MHRRLINLLRSLSRQDLLHLDQFVRSPYFNESELISCLWSFYAGYAPRFDSPELSAESAFELMYPGQEFDKRKINKYNSLLYQLVLEFLAHQQFRHREHDQNLLRLAYFDEAELDDHFLQNLRQARNQLDKNRLRNPRHYYLQWRLARKEYIFLSRRDTRDGDIGLQDLNAALDTHFLIQKAEQLGLMISRQRAVNVQYETSWLREIKGHLAGRPLDDNPSLRMLFSMLKLQLNPDDSNLYDRAKKDLDQFGTFFNTEEQRAFFTILENAAKRCFKPGEYPQAVFQLYQQQIDTGLWQQLNGVPHTLFRNVASAAIHVRRFIWAAKFIEEYAGQIVPEDIRQDVRALTEAEWHFYQGRPQEALLALLPSSPQDVFYKLAGKSLLVRIYFRLCQFKALENALNTFTKFVFDQQKRIAPAKVASYRLFINYLRRLYRLISSDVASTEDFEANRPIRKRSVAKKISRLENGIRGEAFFTGRQWLLQEIELILGVATDKKATTQESDSP